MNNLINNIKNEMKKVIVGQEELIDSLLIGLIANGHILVEGVPGLAKTTAINKYKAILNIFFTFIFGYKNSKTRHFYQIFWFYLVKIYLKFLAFLNLRHAQ